MSSPGGSEYEPDDDEFQPKRTEAPKSNRKSTKGRKLVRWDPERDQMVLLCVDYILCRDGIELDWDAVGKEVADHVTGDAIKQHLLKLRMARDAAGQKCPPRMSRQEVVRARFEAGGNTLLATPKVSRASKRAARRNDKDDDEWNDEGPAKSGPKTSGLLYHKEQNTKKKSSGKSKKPKIKEESDDSDVPLAKRKKETKAKGKVDNKAESSGSASKKRKRPSNFANSNDGSSPAPVPIRGLGNESTVPEVPAPAPTPIRQTVPERNPAPALQPKPVSRKDQPLQSSLLNHGFYSSTSSTYPTPTQSPSGNLQPPRFAWQGGMGYNFSEPRFTPNQVSPHGLPASGQPSTFGLLGWNDNLNTNAPTANMGFNASAQAPQVNTEMFRRMPGFTVGLERGNEAAQSTSSRSVAADAAPTTSEFHPWDVDLDPSDVKVEYEDWVHMD